MKIAGVLLAILVVTTPTVAPYRRLHRSFAWLDSDGNGAFDPNSDEFGFYFGDPLSSYNVQPVACESGPPRV